MPYIGNQPGTGTRNRFIYTATASQTTFSGADDNGKTLKYADSDYVDVYLNGICLVPVTDYTSTSKTSVVLTQAASLNDTLEVIAYDIATIADTVSKANGGTFESNVNFLGDITVGNSTQPRIAGQSQNFDIANVGDSFRSSGLMMQRFESGNSSGPSLLLGKSRGANIGDMDLLQDGDELDKIRFYAADGTNMDHYGGEIKVVIDGTPGANDIPSSMVFSTASDGTATASERWRITPEGHFKAATNGLGIDFSATEGSGATGSVLDDYEKGTFSVGVKDAISGNAATLSGSTGRYTKIGRIVNISFALQISSLSGMTGTNGVNITGLPYTVNNQSHGGGEPHAQILSFISPLSSGDYSGSIITRPNNDTTTCELKFTQGGSQTSQGATSLLINNIASNTYMAGSATYETN